MKRAGYLAIGAAAVLWAIGGSLGRIIIDRGALPLEIAEARAWLAAITFGVVVSARRSRPAAPVSLWYSIVFGMSIASANFFYYKAIGLIPVAIAVVIQYTSPALIVLWLALAKRKVPQLRVVLALALAISGVFLISELGSILTSGSTGLSTAGLVAAAVSALGFAAYILTGEHVQRAFGPEGALFRGFTVAGIFWLLVQIPRGLPRSILDADVLPGVIAIAIGATIVPFALFVWGLGRIGPARAGIASTLEPVSAAVVAWIWLGQTLSLWQIFGAAMVVAGVAVIQSEERAAVPKPAPLE